LDRKKYGKLLGRDGKRGTAEKGSFPEKGYQYVSSTIWMEN